MPTSSMILYGNNHSHRFANVTYRLINQETRRTIGKRAGFDRGNHYYFCKNRGAVCKRASKLNGRQYNHSVRQVRCLKPKQQLRDNPAISLPHLTTKTFSFLGEK